MSEADFYDTNVLLYLLTPGEKAERADELLRLGGVISVQVLNEFASIARRKYGVDWDGIDAFLSAFKQMLKVNDLTMATHEQGLSLAQRYKLPVYDSLLLAAAREAGCSIFWSEDLHACLKIGSLEIRNPFAE